MKNNILFTVTDINLIPFLKEKGITNFVYPLAYFCCGIPKTFRINEIEEDNAFIYINRVLDCSAIDILADIIKTLPSNVKGIIFDDVGIIELLKDSSLQKILYCTHFNTNIHSINAYFDYVDDIIISTDLTKEEVMHIANMTKKPISLMTFGLIPSFYSRRCLLHNHAKHYQIAYENPKKLHVGSQKFLAIEDEFGTILYHYPYFNGLDLLSLRIHYAFYMPLLLKGEDILALVDNDLSNIDYDRGLLDKKTIYKVKNFDSEVQNG